MSYRSDTIANVVNHLNVQYFLPAIQREFVWNTSQIIQLYDSIVRGYPIGSFLFWELKPENRDKWEVYKFVDRFRQGGTHNELASTEGVQQLTLVLDGQQRLTSLLLGLKGSYTIKKKYRRHDDPDAWVRQGLYLDLLKDPRTEAEDADVGVRYGFEFLPDQPRNDRDHHWIKVGRLLNFDSQDDFDDFKESEEAKLSQDATRAQTQVFRRNLDALYRSIWKDEVISYYTEPDQDYDRVLDIFVRANEGGTKLSKSDLLLSMVTSKWIGINARDEIYGFVDRLNYQLDRKNDFEKDFVLKACLVMCDLDVTYRVQNFNNHNLSIIEAHWPKLKSAIESGVRLVNAFGIDRDTLTSVNAVIPIIYYLYRHSGTTLTGTSKFDVLNASWARRWLLAALLNNTFGRASDGVLTRARRILQEGTGQDGYFPFESLKALNERFEDYAVDDFLSIRYGRRETFLALSLLYDENHWGTMPYHVDHIFPRNLFTAKYMAEAGLDEGARYHFWALSDRIGNLQLLRSQENQQKSDQDFSTWLATRDRSFYERHLIPTDVELLKFENFDKFITAREELIRRRLKNVFDDSQTISL
jgi:hypothetical protein